VAAADARTVGRFQRVADRAGGPGLTPALSSDGTPTMDDLKSNRATSPTPLFCVADLTAFAARLVTRTPAARAASDACSARPSSIPGISGLRSFVTSLMRGSPSTMERRNAPSDLLPLVAVTGCGLAATVS
jgi:hypothetical protein